jgi:hypothetical protein
MKETAREEIDARVELSIIQYCMGKETQLAAREGKETRRRKRNQLQKRKGYCRR